MYLDNIPRQMANFDVQVDQKVILILDGLLVLVQQNQPTATRENIIDFVLSKILTCKEVGKDSPKVLLNLLGAYQKQNPSPLHLGYLPEQKVTLSLTLDDLLVTRLKQLLAFVQLTQKHVTMDALVEYIFLTVASPYPQSSVGQLTHLIRDLDRHVKAVEKERRRKAKEAKDAQKAEQPKEAKEAKQDAKTQASKSAAQPVESDPQKPKTDREQQRALAEKVRQRTQA